MPGRALGHPAGALVDLHRALALVLQRGRVALDLQQPLLQRRLLAAAEGEAVGQRVLVLRLERHDLLRDAVELAREPLDLALEELERVLGAAGPEADVLLQDQGDELVRHLRRLLRVRRGEGDLDDRRARALRGPGAIGTSSVRARMSAMIASAEMPGWSA